jgi:hypothetical protein
MKKWVLAILLCAMAASAQRVEEFLAQIRVRVTDDGGSPVSQARVMLSTYNAWVPARQGAGRDEYATETGVTDTNGCVTLSLKGTSGRYNCIVLPLPGFRFDRGQETVFTNAVSGRWEPWPRQVDLVLKRTTPAPSAEGGPATGEAIPPVVDPRPVNVSKDPAIGRRPDPFLRDARH